jgi:hypothetical protein
MLRRDADQQLDSLVLLWDAVASGSASPGPGDNAGDFSLISQLLDRDDAPMPDPGFLSRLEGEVIGLGTGGAATPKTSFSSRLLQGVASASLRPTFKWDPDPRSRLAGYGRWFAAQAAGVLLLLIAIGSVGIIYLAGQSDNTPTIPAIVVDDDATPESDPPEVERLLNAVIDPAAVGAEGQSEWTTASLFMFTLESGEGFALDREAWGSSLNVFTMLQGELSVQSGSSSLVFRQGTNVPETVNAGARITIEAGDSWVAGFDTHVSGQNDGSSDADVLIHANTKDWAAFSPPDSFPGAMARWGHTDVSDLTIQFDGPVTLDLQRVTLGQDEELNVVVSDSETLLLLTEDGNMVRLTKDGTEAGAPRGVSTNSPALHTYPEGAYTITRDYSDPVTLYIARMSNAPAGAQDVTSTPAAAPASTEATPVASAVQPESIASLEIDPASLEAAPAEVWNNLEFAEVHVMPGDSFSTDAPYFIALDGVAVYHIREGMLRLTVDGPLDLYRAGTDAPEQIAAGTPVDVTPGDTVAFALETMATLENTEAGELVMLGGYVSDYTEMSGSITVPAGYVDPFWNVDSDIEPLNPGPVTISYERWSLPPGGFTHVEVQEGDHGLGWNNQSNKAVRMLPGTHDELPDATGVITPKLILDDLDPGDYTFFNPHDVPLTFYLMRVDQPGESTTPAMAQPETLLSTIIEPESVGAESQRNWQSAAAALVTLSPGTSFELNDENWTDGLETFVLLDGEISVESGSASQIIRAGSAAPEHLEAGSLASLAVGDSWIAGIGTSITVSNTGNVEAKMLMHHQGVEQSVFGQGAGTTGNYPANFRPNGTGLANTVNPLPLAGPVSLTLERVTVSDGSAFSLDVAGDETVLLFNEDGRSFDAQRAGSKAPLMLLGGSAIFEYGAGTYTITPIYDDLLVLYIARSRNAENADQSTPVASAPSTETLVSFFADPAAFPIGSPDEWDQIVFEYGYVEPGDGYDTTLLDVSCCRPGLEALHIVAGSMGVELSGPANVIRAGQDPTTPEVYEPSTEIVLGAGDTIWYGSEADAVATNPGADRLSLLKLSAYLAPGEGTEMGVHLLPGFFTTSEVYTNDHTPLQPGVVSLSFQRIVLDPESSSSLTVSENQRLIGLIGQGVIQYLKDTGDKPPPPSLIHSRGQGLGVAFHTFTPGEYIIENNEEEPATLYVLTMTTIPD